jgi:hypothetical protein
LFICDLLVAAFPALDPGTCDAHQITVAGVYANEERRVHHAKGATGMRFQKLHFALLLAAGTFFAAHSAPAADQKQEGQGQAVITVLPGNEMPGAIPQEALHAKVNGKDSEITGWTPLHSPDSKVEMVVLIDDGARSSLGTQMNDMTKFIQGLRPDAKVAVAYMQNGRAAFSGPLTTDHAAAVRELHLPTPGMPGVSASPYFCLSDLAKNWPSRDAKARREVVMVTDGVDNYEMRYDPEDPYVQAAINDSVRAHLIVYSIYWRNQGRFDRTGYAANDGQNLLAQLTQATGGNSYWQGYGDPVSFEPYFADIDRRIDNQYELDFRAPVGSKPELESLKLQVSVRAKIEAPQQVYVESGAIGE